MLRLLLRLRAAGPAAAAGVALELGEDDLGHGAAAQAGERAAHLAGREPVPGAPGPETFTGGPQQGRPGFCVFAVISHPLECLLIADGNTVATVIHSVQEETHSKNKHVADTIRRLRRRHGWSQVQLAQKMGIHSGLVASWETGRSLPKPSNLNRLAEVLGVTAQQIEELEPSETQRPVQQLVQGHGGEGKTESVYRLMAGQIREYVETIIASNRDDPARLGWILHEMRTMFGQYRDPLAGGATLNDVPPAPPDQIASALLRAARARPAPTTPASPRTAASRSSSSADHPPGHVAATATKDDDPPVPSRES